MNGTQKPYMNMIAAILIAIFFLALGLYDGHRNARAGKTWYGMTTRAGNVAMDIKDDQSKFRWPVSRTGRTN